MALFAALLVPTGFFAVAWRDRIERIGRDARGFFRLLLDRDLRRRLAARRRSLVDELGALMRLVPETVLAGPEGPPRS